MKVTAGAKRRRVTTGAAPRAPTYVQELEAEVERLRQRNQELERKLAAVDAREPDAPLTKEEQQGERWRELFLSPDIFKEHIAPHLGVGWTAVLMEACELADFFR